ncbi:MAG: DNA-3-methyladenine glycosylase 2 family protein [Candidatus Pacebacteria bacterium]|nr:DNA-3-methyladenine glycosylase 2 family protein [Candidatus Paceibacterota bacterium]
MITAKHKRHLSKADPILGDLVKRIKPQSYPLQDNYFKSLVRAVANQQLSGKAAKTILDRMVALFPKGEFPNPRQYLKMSDEKLRSSGFSFSKIAYTKNIAQFFIDHKKEMAKINELSDEEVIKLLTSIKGIGVWTAEMFLMSSLGREDIFSFGDLGLRKGIQKVYKLTKEPTLKQMQKIVESWRPYRTHGAMYMWASLVEKDVKK